MTAVLTEANLEDLVLEFLAEEGWRIVYGPNIAPGEPGAERTDYRDVVLVGRLRSAIARLNPSLPTDAVEAAVKTVLRAESQVVMSENWRAYQLLTQGVPVEYRNADGEIREVRAQLVDWENPANNDFAGDQPVHDPGQVGASPGRAAVRERTAAGADGVEAAGGEERDPAWRVQPGADVPVPDP